MSKKRVFSLLLAALLSLSIALPAAADGEPSSPSLIWQFISDALDSVIPVPDPIGYVTGLLEAGERETGDQESVQGNPEDD